MVFQECNKHVSHGVIRIPIRKTNDFGYFLSHNKSKHVLSSDTDIMKDSFFFFYYCKTFMNVSRKVIHILQKNYYPMFFQECNKHVSHGVIRIPIRKTDDFGYFPSHNSLTSSNICVVQIQTLHCLFFLFSLDFI